MRDSKTGNGGLLPFWAKKGIRLWNFRGEEGNSQDENSKYLPSPTE